MSYIPTIEALTRARYIAILAFRGIRILTGTQKAAFVQALRSIDRRISQLKLGLRDHVGY